MCTKHKNVQQRWKYNADAFKNKYYYKKYKENNYHILPDTGMLFHVHNLIP